MDTRYHFVLKNMVMIIDLILVNLCLFLSFYISHQFYLNLRSGTYQYELLICNLIWAASACFFKLYEPATVNEPRPLNIATLKSIVTYAELFVMFVLVSERAYFSNKFLLIFNGLLMSGFLLFRFSMNGFINMLNKHFDLRKVVAVLGTGELGIKLGKQLHGQRGLFFAGYLGQPQNDNATVQPLINMSAKDQVKLAVERGVEEIYVPVDSENAGIYKDLIFEAEMNCIRLKFVAGGFGDEVDSNIHNDCGYPISLKRKEPLDNIQNRVKKRLFDIVVSLFVIIFIFSWLYPLLALLIKTQSPGPVIFSQLRTGRNNKPFWCYKFRSMRLNKESELRQASLNDDRVTSIGHFMRKTSLDEFPQFFNVLLGYMSISGPRPHMISHTDQYSKLIEKYMSRQFIKPGITGWAQVNGYRGETKELWMMKKRIEHDLWYRENWSMLLDVKIVYLTIVNIFKGEDKAY